MPKYSARADSNQAEIVNELRQLGYSVHITHTLGRGFPDLAVGGLHQETGQPITVLVEVKSEGGELTEAEHEFGMNWRGAYTIAYDVRDVLLAFGWTATELEWLN